MREPLILSDTAMVLLRDYMDIKQHQQSMYQAVIQEFLPATASWAPKVAYWMRLSLSESSLITQQLAERLQTTQDIFGRTVEDVEFELMREIWTLWTLPDLRPIRLMDWHLVFDSDLMALAEAYLVTRPEHALRRLERVMVGIVNPYDPFLDRLSAAYQTALTERGKGHP